ncbi:MAG: tetratricopeptide repeat-containing protein [Bdellovibrionales bacterium]|nr:tetratricopeptide repeat-containing protein [Bdellovibrionales bacterium]
MVRAKTFIEAINSFYDSKRKFKSYFTDNRLTALEKTILQCLTWISHSKFDEVIDALKDATASGDKIIDAEKELLLGMAFNNKGDSKKAIAYFTRSLTLMQDSPLKRRQLTASSNLFFCYFNLKFAEGMKSVLQGMLPFEGMTDVERVTILSCPVNCATPAPSMILKIL